MNKQIQFHSPGTVHVRSQQENNAESRTIEGYAILFNTPSAPLWADGDEVVREQIAPEAITKDFLDGCDIKMTMNHNFATLLARSKQGKGTLQYSVDNKGVSFTFDAPHTDDGDRALELVRRGDIDGCSFMFTCNYRNPDVTSETTKNADTGKAEKLYTIHAITGIYDFTLTPMPAYPDTEVSARALREMKKAPTKEDNATQRAMEQIEAMRNETKRTL